MKLVLDSSVAFKWVLKESLSDVAEKLREEFRQGLHDLLSPDILPAEVGHALTRAERQNRISQSQSLVLWADVMMTPPQFVPYIHLMPEALTLSAQKKIGVYDCLYIALAAREQCPVVTADQRLVNTFPLQTVLLDTL